MTPYWSDDTVTLYVGDCLDVLPSLPDASIDAIVTDPPYGLTEISTHMVLQAISAWMGGDRNHVPDGRGFMGKRWDRFVPPPGVWDECLRVLKPGGHLLAFSAPRTADLMGLSIRIAGFEIRDSIHWIFGNGMPKGQDISKAIDKAAGVSRPIVGTRLGLPGVSKNGGNQGNGYARDLEGRDDRPPTALDITAPATQDAARWEGWNTQLKPAHEPIIVARKPFTGTFAANVLAHGTGALNIDASRVGMREARQLNRNESIGYGGSEAQGRVEDGGVGRWPSNVVFSHPPLLDDTGQIVGDACADGCVDGGTLTVRVYGDGRGDLAPVASAESLLDRLQALLADLRASSRSGTTLWPGASEFYRSEGTQSSEGDARRSLGDVVESALRQSVVPGSPAGCRSCRDSDDALVHRVLEAAQGGLPSLLDALGHEIRQADRCARSRLGRHCDRQSSSDALHVAEPSSCSRRSSISGECLCLSSEGGSRCRKLGTGSQLSQRAGLGDSSPANSTASPCGSSGTCVHSVCRYATVRLLTLLTFDLASRFAVPNPGVYAREVALSRPQCPVAELDAQSGERRTGGDVSGNEPGVRFPNTYGDHAGRIPYRKQRDAGGASKFFHCFRYSAKAGSAERPRLDDGTAHATVKPLALIRWLARLITPPGGLILDPFAGTGPVAEAAIIEGFRAVLIELEQPHAELIRVRLDKPIAPVLFGDTA